MRSEVEVLPQGQSANLWDWDIWRVYAFPQYIQQRSVFWDLITQTRFSVYWSHIEGPPTQMTSCKYKQNTVWFLFGSLQSKLCIRVFLSAKISSRLRRNSCKFSKCYTLSYFFLCVRNIVSICPSALVAATVGPRVENSIWSFQCHVWTG